MILEKGVADDVKPPSTEIFEKGLWVSNGTECEEFSFAGRSVRRVARVS